MGGRRQKRKKHNVLIKNSLKEIVVNRKRFISIMLMALLGVGFFAGLVSSGPDMRDSLDKFLDDTNTYDINIVSTLGLTEDDIEEIKKLDNIEYVQGVYSKDISVETDSSEYVFKAIQITENINNVVLLDGRIPENENECVVEEDFIKNTNYNIGDILVANEDEELNNNEFKIVGTVSSPLYLSMERGTTSLGSGTVDYYMYVDESNFNMDYYSNIYVQVKNAKEKTITTDEYTEMVDEVISNIENIQDERELARYKELVSTANDELQENIDEFEKSKKEGEEELEKAEKEIEDGEKQIESSEKELEDGKKQANREFANARNTINSSLDELEKSEEEYNSGLKQYEEALDAFNSEKNKLNNTIETLEDNLSLLENLSEETQNKIDEINNQIENGDDSNLEELNILEAQLAEINSDINDLETNINTINRQISSAQKELNSTKNTLDEAYEKIQDGYKELESARKELATQEANTENEFSKAEKEIDNAKDEIKEAKETYEEEKKKFDEEIEKAEKEIEDAKEDIANIKEAEWYVLSREDDSGYSSFVDSIDSMNNIAKLFPTLFYVVAILISSTSMTRMVEEERVEIGTLKALGYSNFKIINKYILYSLLSTLLGGIIGMFIGFVLIPSIVWENYNIIYYLPKFYTEFRYVYGILGIIIAIICISGATIQSAYKELKNAPSVLMRPKAPKMGKKVILEKIPFIWKRLNFSSKTTTRNLFRYKKRALMTIIGISGCTALILAGFGLRDSITDIAELQYGKVFNYDLAVSLKNADLDLINSLKEDNEIEYLASVEGTSGTIEANGIKKDSSIIVIENNDDFKKIANLTDIVNKQPIEISDNGVLISDKLASILEVEKGNSITITDSENNKVEYKVDGVVENYIGHYVYMSKSLYESTGKEYSTNSLFIKTNNLDEEKSLNSDNNSNNNMNVINEDGNEDSNISIEERLLDDNSVSSVTVVENTLDHVNDLLKSLDLVVMILIVASALLAFVVLYNLANVNISERVREIATLKVLGFYDKEVDNYINRESIVLTCIGIVIGLVLGYFLTGFVISTCETEGMRFGRNIMWLSYVYAASITGVFSIIVNYVTHFVLKKVDMVESLKSIE